MGRAWKPGVRSPHRFEFGASTPWNLPAPVSVHDGGTKIGVLAMDAYSFGEPVSVEA